MKILIDADGCPVVKLAIQIGLKYNLEILLISDTSHVFNFNNNVKLIIADKGKDSSDFIILNKALKDDIVITQDYALASICLTKGCFPINQNGFLYTNENIDELLFRKHINKKLRKIGKMDYKIKKRLKKDDEKFAINFNKLIEHVYNNNS